MNLADIARQTGRDFRILWHAPLILIAAAYSCLPLTGEITFYESVAKTVREKLEEVKDAVQEAEAARKRQRGERNEISRDDTA